MLRDSTNRRNRQAGFSLIESAVAIVILTIGVTAVAAVFVRGFSLMGNSQDDLIARIKAQEAVESVFAGRDDQSLTWSQILNVQGATGADGGIFIDGALPVNDPGADGLVNTADDQPGTLEYIVQPGPDGVYGTADDVQVPLAKFTREIRIRTVSPNLRSLTVIVTYSSNGLPRRYTITTYISPFV
ncbi:MAG TPA: prepilin-type N-terminal cleavage/methylation domain-containing protein [Candidatus Solibacter sp.]|nr:prepilin-type N-terminal cleavage/methylation domain-containing protein [Candidatus Solibacter sp.]